MKYLIASDIHGSYKDLETLFERIKEEKPNKIVLLGDIYYHGPRNDLPSGYNPKTVAQMLNGIKDFLMVVKGNCDAEVDEMISDFIFHQNIAVKSNGKIVLFTHGHRYNKDSLPAEKIDCLVYGHYHTGFIEKGEITFANAGSISLPKNGTPKSFLILEEGVLTLKTLNGEIITQTEI